MMSRQKENAVKRARYNENIQSPRKRKKEDGSERLENPNVSRFIPRNHGNGMASLGAGFSIDNILSSNSQVADLRTSPRPQPTAPAEQKRSTPLLSSEIRPDEEKLENLDGEKEMKDIDIGAKTMPIDKWYNTLLWQQHQQQYQQHVAATAPAFYHPYHLPQHVSNHTNSSQIPPHPHVGPVQPLSGFPPGACPAVPGSVHPYTCRCAEQMSDQPYFLLTPAGYSIPSPFQPDPYFSSHRYCRRRKARTVFNDYQIRGLENRFVHQQYLSTHERVDLASMLCLTEAQVKTWFQNRRMKEKKLTRDPDHQSDEDDDELNPKVKPKVDGDLDDESKAKANADI